METLHIEESHLLQQLATAREAEVRARREPVYTKGARIVITNAIVGVDGKPSTSINDTRAFIKKVQGDRVHFRTVNGHHTWRSKKNIRLVKPSEVWSDSTL